MSGRRTRAAGAGRPASTSRYFLTETAQLANVVLPAATWGEKTGTFTNADRTVHLSEQAVDPPGEARSDLAIFLDYARRMDFRDRGGRPLIGWSDPEGAFEAWKRCSRGRPCDYSALTYDRLRESPVQWPCTEDAPDGTERLYAGGVFNTDPDYAETYGHDLKTGATLSEDEARAKQPAGRAYLQAADYEPGPEQPDDAHPLLLTTGRTVYHFHTRTKTGRAPELRAPARITGIREGVVFVPFHYGYWDHSGPHTRAANELTAIAWDPVSKQPPFKITAVRVAKAG